MCYIYILDSSTLLQDYVVTCARACGFPSKSILNGRQLQRMRLIWGIIGGVKYYLTSDCPTVPILLGQYRCEGLCPKSRLYLSWDNECPAIDVLVYIHAARIARLQQLLNYSGRSDVSSARANAALGAIINVTRTYVRIFIYCTRALALYYYSATRRKAELFSLRSNRYQSC